MAQQKIIFITGPSCSGKSTIIRNFSSEMLFYIEDIKNNPHIPKSDYPEEFNAFKSQMWFIQTMYDFIDSLSVGQDIIIDQSPEAITYTYSKYFLDKGFINQREFSILEDELLKIKKLIESKNYIPIHILLNAPSKDLYERAKLRDKENVMTLEWFTDINQCFIDYYMNGKNIIKLETAKNSAYDIIEKIKKIIQ